MLYPNDYFINKYHTHQNNDKNHVYIFFNMLYDVFFQLAKFEPNTTFVPGEVKKTLYQGAN